MSRVWQGLAMAIALAAMTAGGVVIAQDGGDAGEAHLWVDADGGTCTRSGSLAEYVSAAACANPVAAWAASSSGDTIRVKAKSGGYNLPTSPDSGHFVSSKTSTTKIIGDEAGVIINTGATAGEFVVRGNNFWLENVTLDSGSVHGWSARFGAPDSQGGWNPANVSLIDVNVKGLYFGMQSHASNFVWDGGVFGEEGVAGERCDATNSDIEPVELHEGNARIANIVFWPQGGADACGNDGFHEEDIRIHTSDTTIENVDFKDGNAVNRNAGSGKIFLSGSNVQNLVIRNVIFGRGEPTSNNHIDANVSGCTVTIAYVTYTDKGTNLAGCTVTNIHNLGPNATGVSVTTGRIDASATSAIDQGEADCSSTLGSAGNVDIDGDPRPTGSACDKGADEYVP